MGQCGEDKFLAWTLIATTSHQVASHTTDTDSNVGTQLSPTIALEVYQLACAALQSMIQK